MMLKAAQVRYILIGSVAAAIYGVPVNPGDFDIAPDLERDNLLQLGAFLKHIGAKPSTVGHWTVNDSGEKTWVESDLTADERTAFRENWMLKT